MKKSAVREFGQWVTQFERPEVYSAPSGTQQKCDSFYSKLNNANEWEIYVPNQSPFFVTFAPRTELGYSKHLHLSCGMAYLSLLRMQSRLSKSQIAFKLLFYIRNCIGLIYIHCIIHNNNSSQYTDMVLAKHKERRLLFYYVRKHK